MKSGVKTKVIAAMAAVYIIWSTTYMAIKFAVMTIPPIMMCGVRYFTAGIIMYAFHFFTSDKKPTLKEWRDNAIVGAFLVTGGTAFTALGMKTVSSGLAAVAISAVAIWSCIISGFFGQKTKKTEWLGVAIGFIGIVVLNMESDFKGNAQGAVFLMIAPISWAIGSFMGQRLHDTGGLLGNALQMTSGGVITVLAGLAAGERITAQPSMLSLAGLYYLIIFGSIIGYSAYMYLFKNAGHAMATSYAYVNPVLAVFIGVIFGGESINTPGIAAMVLVVTGVIFVLSGSKNEIKSS